MIFKDYEIYQHLFGIYKIECGEDNGIYIGACTCEFRYRFQTHKSRLRQHKHQKLLQNAYDKYGADSFVFSIVQICDKNDDIAKLEVQYINYYKSKSNKNIYNIHKGGETVGNKLSEDTRHKMSMSRKGTKLSEHQHAILMEYNKNKKLTDEQKKFLSQRFVGSKSNFAILDEGKVADIKRRLMNNENVQDIADLYNVNKACVDNIRLNYRWKHVYVDGWEDYQNNRPKRHMLTENELKSIIQDLKNSVTLYQINVKYHISYDKIYNIIKQYNIKR